VVDDTPDILLVICALLSTDDRIEIIGRATDGREALEAVGSLRPELVLMDVQMPIMDGLSAAALIRLKFPEVSIVLMSACPSHLIDNQIHASGADAFIDKLEFSEIFPRVLSQLRTADQTRV
jgi:CheY-like chemotaxis protein